MLALPSSTRVWIVAGVTDKLSFVRDVKPLGYFVSDTHDFSQECHP